MNRLSTLPGFGPLSRGLHVLSLCRQIADYSSLDRMPVHLRRTLGIEHQD